ncbi:MAG: glutathione S-transferase family protein [Steroidobacteraceae bacterium]
MSLTLYYHPLASFCHKVLIALYENHIAFEPRIIDLGNPKDLAELQTIWPFAGFPVIRDHRRGRDLPESTLIIEYLDHHFPAEHRLIPDNWEGALEVRIWDRLCDNQIQLPIQKIVRDRLMKTNLDTSRERATLQTAYTLLEKRLAQHHWLGGASFSMAECSAAPALFYAHTLEPFPASCPKLSAYFDRLVQRPSVRRVLSEAQPYFGLYPFAEAIPARFLSH